MTVDPLPIGCVLAALAVAVALPTIPTAAQVAALLAPLALAVAVASTE